MTAGDRALGGSQTTNIKLAEVSFALTVQRPVDFNNGENPHRGDLRISNNCAVHTGRLLSLERNSYIHRTTGIHDTTNACKAETN